MVLVHQVVKGPVWSNLTCSGTGSFTNITGTESSQICTTVFTQHKGAHRCQQARQERRARLPHALRGLVAVVTVQLWHAQHGLSQHGQEAQGLHKQGRIDGQVRDVACYAREGQDTLHVICKAAPVPEVVRVEV